MVVAETVAGAGDGRVGLFVQALIEVLDGETLSKLVKKSKELGYSVSTLFEAAHALAIFHSNKDADPEQDIHVTMEGS